MKTCLILIALALVGGASSANAAGCAGGHAKPGIHHGIGLRLHLPHSGGGGGGGGLGCGGFKTAKIAHVHKGR